MAQTQTAEAPHRRLKAKDVLAMATPDKFTVSAVGSITCKTCGRPHSLPYPVNWTEPALIEWLKSHQHNF